MSYLRGVRFYGKLLVPPLVDTGAAYSNSIIMQTFRSLALFFQMINQPTLYIELPCGRHCPNTFACVVLINQSSKHYLHFTDGETEEMRG